MHASTFPYHGMQTKYIILCKKEIIKFEDNNLGSIQKSLGHTGKEMTKEEYLLVSFLFWMGSIHFPVKSDNIMSFEGAYALLFFLQVTMNSTPSKLHCENNIFSLAIGPEEVFFNINIFEEYYTYFQQL